MLPKSLIEKLFEMAMSVVQNSVAIVRKDIAKAAARKDANFKLIMEKFGGEGQMKKSLDENEWSKMNIKLNENTRAVYNHGQAMDEIGRRYNSQANNLDIGMKRLNAASDSVVNAILTLVLTTITEK
ncbi:hypothetical protein ACH5RR_012280 [Cinchona calisaya]|uniref:Uncharacterized protein n=1 Tax=Cinchona calisaya TaxID=153742 RepID=A0ABD3A7A2_9GENT